MKKEDNPIRETGGCLINISQLVLVVIIIIILSYLIIISTK
jgi:hypothetical protein